MSALRIFDKFAKLLDVNWGSIADGNFLKRSGANIVGASAGTGDVVGPGSAVNDHLPLFDGTTGKLIKDGLVAPTGAIVGTTDTQTLTNKKLVSHTVEVAGVSFRPSGVLLVNTSVVTTSGAGSVLVWTYTIPIGMLGRDGDSLRVSWEGSQNGTAAVSRGYRIFFPAPATLFFDLSSAPTSQRHHSVNVIISRVNSSTVKGIVLYTSDGATGWAQLLSGSPDLTASVDISLYVFQAAVGSTATHNISMIEYLPAP